MKWERVVTLHADIAGVGIALRAPPAWIDGPLGQRYRRFPSTSATPRVCVELIDHTGEAGACAAEDWRGAEAFHEAVRRGDAPDNPIELTRAGERLLIQGAFFSGWLDIANGRGEGRACSQDPIGSVENYFRVALAHLLLPEGGFLLHACAVVVDGGAVVAFGESGAGKSTLASLAGERPVISDDLVALRRDGRGRLVAVPAPFRPGGADARAEGHVVRGLYRLRQGPAFSVRPLGHVAGAASIVGSMPFVLDEPDSARVALGLAETAAAIPGVDELTFAPVAGLWDAIEAALARGDA